MENPVYTSQTLDFNPTNLVNSNDTPEESPLCNTTTTWNSTKLIEKLCDEFEYMECGSSPPTDSVPDINCSFEDFSKAELTVQICHDTIKANLYEHMKSVGGRYYILDEIESKRITNDNLESFYKNASEAELNISLLWAAFVKHWELLEGLIRLGACFNYAEPFQGLSALHLACFSGCVTSTKYLISKGANVNACAKNYTPLHCAAFGDSPETALCLLNNGAQVSSSSLNCTTPRESALHCAVRANAVACVKLFITEGAEVDSIGTTGVSALHLAADLGHIQCLHALVDSKAVNLNVKTKDKELTPLHLAAEGGFDNCAEWLLQKGADPMIPNHRGQTALHLACRSQSLECVDVLLKKGKVNPNAMDNDKRTALHAAVGKAARSFEIIDSLLHWGAEVNAKDQYGYTPLHIAALNELSQCVEILIYHGADVTAKSKFGMSALGIIIRKTPAALKMVYQRLDQAVTLHHYPEGLNKEVELRLDFRNILQHCHPKEISFLNAFVDEGLKEILLHPLCAAFLHLKWEKIRKYYLARIFFCFLFVCSLSLYVLTALAHSCHNYQKNLNSTEEYIELCQKESVMGALLRSNPFALELQWFVLVGLTGCEILRKIYGIAGYSSIKQYMSHTENLIEWTVIASVFAISFVYTGKTHMWQNHVGAFAVLFGWTNLMLMIGQLPVFGSYVAMYTRVQGEFAKLLLAYSCLLIGFTISFCVIFPDSSMFANPFIGLITVLVMMTGELNLDILTDDDPIDPPFLLEISAQVTYILFLLFVTVILMNLLVGIAVHDIQGLQKTAGLSKLVRQTKLISYMELALFNGYLPKCMYDVLHWTALVSPRAYRVVLNVKPLNPREKRLPKEVLKAAYETAKQNRNRLYGGSCYTGTGTTSTKKEPEVARTTCTNDIFYNIDEMSMLNSKLEQNIRLVKQFEKDLKNIESLLASNQATVAQLVSILTKDQHSTNVDPSLFSR